MKNIVIYGFASALLMLGKAQGVVVFSSITNTGGTTSVITGGGSSGKAVSFVMPATPTYILASVVLNLNSIADAGIEIPLISIWSDDTVTPATPIGGYQVPHRGLIGNRRCIRSVPFAACSERVSGVYYSHGRGGKIHQHPP